MAAGRRAAREWSADEIYEKTQLSAKQIQTQLQTLEGNGMLRLRHCAEVSLIDRQQAEGAIGKITRWYNEERLHRALGYLRPIDYHRGQPEALREARRLKLSQARHRRRERNLQLKQPTLPLEADCQPPSLKPGFVPLRMKHSPWSC